MCYQLTYYPPPGHTRRGIFLPFDKRMPSFTLNIMAKKKNGKMDLEKLALIVERGFAQTATKQELREEITGLRREMLERFDKLELHLSASVIRLREDVEYLHDYMKTIERRLKRVEARK
jgi:hypothetical protein